MNVYVSIGNSDGKLTQAEWAIFVSRVRLAIAGYAEAIHGKCYSASHAFKQNAIFSFEIEPEDAAMLREDLRVLATKYQQDSIAWAHVLEVELLKPLNPEGEQVDSPHA